MTSMGVKSLPWKSEYRFHGSESHMSRSRAHLDFPLKAISAYLLFQLGPQPTKHLRVRRATCGDVVGSAVALFVASSSSDSSPERAQTLVGDSCRCSTRDLQSTPDRLLLGTAGRAFEGFPSCLEAAERLSSSSGLVFRFPHSYFVQP